MGRPTVSLSRQSESVVSPRDRSLARKVHSREVASDEMPMCRVDEKIKDGAGALYSCRGGQNVALDYRSDRSCSKLQVGGRIREEALPVSEQSLSQGSHRTASTELYVPSIPVVDTFQDPCITGAKSGVPNLRQLNSPCTRTEVGTGDEANCLKRKRSDSTKKCKKQRKASKRELAAGGVEAAIGRIVSAAEAMVVSQLMNPSNSSLSLDSSSLLEAALSLGKARNLCGLDKYELSTTAEGSVEIAWEDLDMEDAYADVGVSVEVEKQLLGVGTKLLKHQETLEALFSEKCKTSGSLETGEQDQGKECFKEAANCKLVELDLNETAVEDEECKQVSHLEIRDGKTGDHLRLVVEAASEQQSQQTTCCGVETLCTITCPSMTDGNNSDAVTPFDSKVDKGKFVAEDHRFSAGCNLLEPKGIVESARAGKEVGQLLLVGREDTKQCETPSEVSAEPLSIKFSTAERASSVNLEDEASVIFEEKLRLGSELEMVTCNPESNFGEAVAILDRENLVVKDTDPESDTQYVEISSSLKVLETPVEGEHEGGTLQPCLQGEATGRSGVLESSAIRVTELLQSKNLESTIAPNVPPISTQEQSPLDLSTFSTKLLAKMTTPVCFTPYTSRWIGGWTGQAEPNASTVGTVEMFETTLKRSHSTGLCDFGSENVVPEHDAVLMQNQGTLTGNDILNTVPPVISEVMRVVRTDEQNDFPEYPLGFFVPCSLSTPHALSLPTCDKGHERSELEAALEAMAHDSVVIMDSQVNCQPPTLTVQLDGDPVADAGPEVGFSVNNTIGISKLKDGCVRRELTSMRELSTISPSFSLLLQAADLAENSVPEDDDYLDYLVSGALAASSPCLQAVPKEVDNSAEHDPDPSRAVKKTTLAKRRMTASELLSCGELAESPPHLWPGRKKRRLNASKILDTQPEILLSNVSIADFPLPADDEEDSYELVDPGDAKRQGANNVGPRPGKINLRSSNRNMLNKPCHDPKKLFKGCQFLLTGFDPEMKTKLSKSIERHGGDMMMDIPIFSPKQRFKRRGVDCGPKSHPIVVAPSQMRTPKFLFGCAVGSPLLQASWITACISAVKVLPYYRYQHKQPGPALEHQTGERGGLRGSDNPLFLGLLFHFYGQEEFISQFSTLAKHAGGKVIRRLLPSGKAAKKLVGLVVSEGSNKVPLDLLRQAVQLDMHVVNAEWMILSLLNGSLQPWSTKSTAQIPVCATQQSSASAALEPQLPENHGEKEDGRTGIGLLVKKLKNYAFPEKNGPAASSVRGDSGVVADMWVEKGFTVPPQVPPFAAGIMGLYSNAVPRVKLAKGFMYNKAFMYKGVEYFLGDTVELQSTCADSARTFARIEGMWCDEGRLSQTKTFKGGVRKRTFRSLVLHCRRFYQPLETGFPVQGTNELFLSNNFEHSIPACDIVRRVRIVLEVAGKVVHTNNWYESQEMGPSSQKEGLNAANSGLTREFTCHFFYNHTEDSLHLIKIEQDPIS